MSRSTILVWKMTFEAPSCHISVLRVSPGKTCFANRACMQPLVSSMLDLQQR